MLSLPCSQQLLRIKMLHSVNVIKCLPFEKVTFAIGGCDGGVLFVFFETRSLIGQCSPKHQILLAIPPKYWDYSCVPPLLTDEGLH